MFRPLGQRMFAQLVAELSKSYDLEDIFEWLSWLPTLLDQPPYADVIWDTGTRKMTSSKTDAAIVRDVLLHMLGEDRRAPEDLRKKYAQYLGEENAKLPELVVESNK